MTIIRDDEDILVTEKDESETVDERDGKKSKRKKTKHVDRDASSLAFMIYSTVISREDYLLQNKGKKTESAAKVEVVVQDLHYNDEGENNVSEENIFQQQMNKIKDAVVLLTERVIQDAGMGMFLEDHVSFASAICIEILQLSDKEKDMISRNVDSFEPVAYCDLTSNNLDILVHPIFFLRHTLSDGQSEIKNSNVGDAKGEKKSIEVPKVVAGWMTIDEWIRILEVAKLDDFETLPVTIQKSAPAYSSMWQTIFRSTNPLLETFPPPWNKLSIRQRSY